MTPRATTKRRATAMASSSSSSSTTIAVTAATILTTAIVSYCIHRITQLNRQVSHCQKERAAERTGRIRAEVKLRTALKQQQSTNNGNTFTLRQIGTVVSPFTKRMGTPRQGALAVSSRGYIEFSDDIQPAALEGLEHYSHVWILFEFHANTDVSSITRKSKIKPPRAPHKVGMLSTRSPHRPNPIGLSLVKMESVQKRRLYISALDLVNGTPVYDVKPCVPWDVPGVDCSMNTTTCSDNAATLLVVPEWVSQHDAMAHVEFTSEATNALQDIVKSKHGISPAYQQDEVDLVQSAIQEVLAQDPRSGHTRGTITTCSSKPYNFMFGCAQVEFVVTGNGVVQVVGIQQVEFPDEAYVDGIPLASEASA
jgi:tRNA-Thr(GGU) m(6)t(6)A37 methyltransferase TsaA